MENKSKINGSLEVPEELVQDILLRLPVKSLCQFKCVSKEWYGLIESPSFVKLHFGHKSNRERLLVRIGENDQGGNRFGMVDVDEEDEVDEDENDDDDDDERMNRNNARFIPRHDVRLYDQPYKYALYVDESFSEYEVPAHLQMTRDEFSDVFGPFNGIFCVVSHFPWGPMALLNPALRQYKTLPMVKRVDPENKCFLSKVFGMGWDPLTGDYKIVLIINFLNYENNLESLHDCVVYVCTSDSDSWRIIEDVDFYIKGMTHKSLCTTYLNGSYYWTLVPYDLKNDIEVLAFDMGTDKFRRIQVPEECGTQSKHGYLALCGDTLALLKNDNSDDDISVRFIDIWLMKDEGCWIKGFSVGPLEGISWPVCFWNHDELFLETMTSFLAQCNVNSTQEMKTFRAQRTCHLRSDFAHWVFVYKESFVSLKGKAGNSNCKLWDTSFEFVKDILRNA